MKPLSGITVIDLSTVILGPYASQILGDYGARIIKIESPEGDSTRYTGPYNEMGMSAMFLGSNRNKESVVLNLKNNPDQQALIELIKHADVFMHSMRPQKLKKLGIDPESLQKINPRLVYAGLQGFGFNGPYVGKPAYDDIIQGLSGSVALMQEKISSPSYFPTIAADKTCALYAAQAILAALLGRERSGQGCFVEIPMFESMTAFNLVENFYGQHFVPEKSKPGYPRLLDKSRKPYKTLDGYICMMPYTNTHWQNFFKLANAAELAHDERFINIANRTKNIQTLYQIVSDLIALESSSFWLTHCDRLEIPASKVNQLDDLINDEHLKAISFFKEIVDPQLGTLRFPNSPISFNHVCAEIKIPPRLGEHTLKVLNEYGINTDFIKH